jgi:hypothetical protein
MQRFLVERRLRDVHERLVKARQELALLDEQLAVIDERFDDVRIRSLVAETPQAAHDYSEVRRTKDALDRARLALSQSVEELQKRRDTLLMSVGSPR